MPFSSSFERQKTLKWNYNCCNTKVKQMKNNKDKIELYMRPNRLFSTCDIHSSPVSMRAWKII